LFGCTLFRSNSAANFTPHNTKGVLFVTAFNAPHDVPIAVLTNEKGLWLFSRVEAMGTAVVVDKFSVALWAEAPKT
jgi:hypothetical protein